MFRRIFHRYYHLYKDWIFLACLVIFFSCVFVGYGLYRHHSAYTQPLTTYRSGTYDFYDNELYKIEPPDPRYPAPAKEQLSFYRSYNTGDLTFSLEWTERNVDRNASIGEHKFTLVIQNQLNSARTTSNEAMNHVSVGCIAYDNPYHSVSVSPMRAFALGPYEQRRFAFSIDVSCMYIGTADGQYFWRIYWH